MYAPFRLRKSENKARDKQYKIRETGNIMNFMKLSASIYLIYD